MKRPASPGALPAAARATARSLAEHTTSALTAVALVTLVSIVGFLLTHAASSPALASAMPAIYAGLFASSLVLVRQWKKDWNARRAGQAGAAHMAFRDPVTQLLNADGFADALAHYAPPSDHAEESLAILCVSLGRLKDIYDRLGESCGDEVLRDLSARLVSAFGDDAPVGRIGEDMLAVFHPASSGIKLALVGGQINRLMDLPVATPGGDVIVPSTIGVNFVEMPVATPRDAIRQARLANSAARTSGSGLAFFEASLDHAQRLQLDLEIELRQALQAGELQMVYQPQINETGATIGVEALMRWPHPTRGQIPPAVFVPMAEAAGLGEALGRYAIDRSFADSTLWPGLKIAINVSPVQLRSPTFIATVKTLLARHGVKANGFEFEITEGVLLDADATVLGNLEQLRRMGFQIALDDFGTGYSSLSYLGRFPVDKIKIDRAFVTPLGLRSDASSIIRAISDLSEAIGVKVLAEGVETRSQLDILRAEGCNQAQGYLIGRPMQPDQITDLIKAPASDARNERAA
ncbi:bifunctional diguanylate cyclase/phosphodiesterase [Brevundimonas sp.]|uniref:putative bifunctional diguanylate cyclase/phosphodiesterase n=1 Tax=Brevundimonas sp. TaxID=1871086 RepID=UPI00286C5A89|nr:bifunctional diguanylate cyclase/phosphodiesterase [Brevundimonas sp.]